MSSKKILIFNGSPRKKGTSYSFARTVKQLAELKGSTVEILHVADYIDDEKALESLREAVAESDILALSVPLYVDCLPQQVIWFFERLVKDFKDELKGKSFFAIGQSAFPYPELINALIGSCRCFAEAAGMKWLGGLRYGGGVMLNGEYLENLGKKGEKITSAFRLALEDILENRLISPEPQEMLNMNFPKLLARPMALFLNHMIREKGRKNGFTTRDLEKKVYLE